MNTTIKTSKIGSNHATFSGNEYMFIEWMYKVKPEFEYEKLPTVEGDRSPCTAVSGVTLAF
jgi:hypothetical protein